MRLNYVLTAHSLIINHRGVSLTISKSDGRFEQIFREINNETIDPEKVFFDLWTVSEDDKITKNNLLILWRRGGYCETDIIYQFGLISDYGQYQAFTDAVREYDVEIYNKYRLILEKPAATPE